VCTVAAVWASSKYIWIPKQQQQQQQQQHQEQQQQHWQRQQRQSHEITQWCFNNVLGVSATHGTCSCPACLPACLQIANQLASFAAGKEMGSKCSSSRCSPSWAIAVRPVADAAAINAVLAVMITQLDN
jgi:hypothetical protein